MKFQLAVLFLLSIIFMHALPSNDNQDTKEKDTENKCSQLLRECKTSTEESMENLRNAMKLCALCDERDKEQNERELRIIEQERIFLNKLNRSWYYNLLLLYLSGVSVAFQISLYKNGLERDILAHACLSWLYVGYAIYKTNEPVITSESDQTPLETMVNNYIENIVSTPVNKKDLLN